MRSTNAFIKVKCENFNVCGNKIEIELFVITEKPEEGESNLWSDSSVNFDLVDSGWLVTPAGDFCEDCRDEQEQ